MKKIVRILSIIMIIIVMFVGTVFATVNPNQTEFKVRFSGKPEVSNAHKVNAAVTNDLNATINVTGLTVEENTENVTYIIQNTSKDLSADLSIETTNSNKEYFEVETKLEKTRLIKGEATKVSIKIKLIKKPIIEHVNTTIGIRINAMPVQPSGQTPGINPPSGATGKNEKDETPKTGNEKFIDIF